MGIKNWGDNMKKNYDSEVAKFLRLHESVADCSLVKWDMEFLKNKLYREAELVELKSKTEVNEFADNLRERQNCYGISDYFEVYTDKDFREFKQNCTDDIVKEGLGYLKQIENNAPWDKQVSLAMCVAIREGSWFSKVCKNKIRQNIISKMKITSVSQTMLSQYYSDFVLDIVEEKLWTSYRTDFVAAVNSYLRPYGSAYKSINSAYKVASYDNDGDVGLQNEIASLATTPPGVGGESNKTELVQELLEKLKKILSEDDYHILLYNSNYTRNSFEKNRISYSKKKTYGMDFKNSADYVNFMCGFKGTEKELTPEQLVRRVHAIKKRVLRELKYIESAHEIKEFSKKRPTMLNWETSQQTKVKRYKLCGKVQENCDAIYESEYNKFFKDDFNEESCALAYEMKTAVENLGDEVYFKIAELSKKDCETKSAEILDDLMMSGYKAKSKEYALCL